MKIKHISGKEMAKVDDFAMNEYGLKSEFMMENAGRNIAEFVSKLTPRPKRVVVFFGKGNNGGDGLVAARHLSIKGFNVEIISTTNKIEELNDSIKEQLKILYKSGIKTKKDIRIKKEDVIIDALLGYSVKGSARGRIRELINTINFSKNSIRGLRIVSVDVPSGLNPDGDFEKQINKNPIVNADYILTLGLSKKSLRGRKNIYLVNIGVPWKVYKELGIIKTRTKSYFKDKDIVRIS